MATKKASSSETAAKREARKARLEAAKAKAEAAKARASVISGGHASGFFNFIRQQGIVSLAVGLAVGTAAVASVKQIVDGFINPIVGFLIGGIDLSKLTWTVIAPKEDGTGGLIISWGAILSSLITLVATALVIYLIIHLAKLDRLDKKKS